MISQLINIWREYEKIEYDAPEVIMKRIDDLDNEIKVLKKN